MLTQNWQRRSEEGCLRQIWQTVTEFNGRQQQHSSTATMTHPSTAPSTAASLTQSLATPLAFLRQTFRLNAFGLKLFAMIMGGALAGMGGMAFLFGETVKYQAEEQIRNTLETKVSTLNEVIGQTETLAYTLGVSVSTLHVRGAETVGTYRELTRQLFLGRPDYVVGLGFGQSEYGILSDRRWFFPFYQALPEVSAAASESLDYRNQAESAQPYQTSELYRQYFVPQQKRWRPPYQQGRQTLLTYYQPIFDSGNRWLGTAVIELDSTYFNQLLDTPAFRKAGELILLTQSGQVIAHPSNPRGLSRQSIRDIPELATLWAEMSPTASGFVEGDSGYWAYTYIPEQQWRLVAFVPYRAVFGPVMLITLGATTLVTLLLALLVAWAIRHLNQRLQPVIDECQRLSETDDELAQRLQRTDELGQLSLSFFNLLDQLQLSQSQVREEVAHALDAEERLQAIRKRAIANQNRQRQAAQQLEAQSSAQAHSTHDHYATLLASLQQLNIPLQALAHTVLTAQGDAQQQAELAATLQTQLEATQGQLAQWQPSLAHWETTTQAHPLAASEPLISTLNRHLLELCEQIPALSDDLQALRQAADSLAQEGRKQQRTANAAQVLLLNASTLAISASQRQSPEEFENLIQQFQTKDEQLKGLREQLENARQSQYHHQEQLQNLVEGLLADFSRCAQTAAAASAQTESAQRALQDTQTMAEHIGQTHQSCRHMVEQMSHWQAVASPLVAQIAAIAATLETHTSLGCKKTQQVEQLAATLIEDTRQYLRSIEQGLKVSNTTQDFQDDLESNVKKPA